MNWLAAAALAVFLVAGGIGFGSPSLAVAGVGTGALAALAPAWVALAAKRARVVRADGPARVVEGDSYPLAIELRPGLLPPPGGELRDSLLAKPRHVGPLGPRVIELRIRLPRRGRIRLAAAEWAITDPLGLAARTVRSAPAGELLVLPRVEPVSGRIAVAGFGAGPAGQGTEDGSGIREARAIDFEVDGVRPYREGTPASRIHWAAVARTGELYERRMAAGGDAVPLVVLDAQAPADPEALDRAVRAAGSICVHLASRGGCAVSLPGYRLATFVDASLRTWPLVHGRLALVAAGAPAAVPSRASRRGSVIWVTAADAARALALLRSFGSGPHYLVSANAAPRGLRRAFAVAGCSGFAVGAAARAAA